MTCTATAAPQASPCTTCSEHKLIQLPACVGLRPTLTSAHDPQVSNRGREVFLSPKLFCFRHQ